MMVDGNYITYNQAFIRLISNGYSQRQSKEIVRKMLVPYRNDKLFKKSDLEDLLVQLRNIKIQYKSANYIQKNFHISKTTFYRLLRFAEGENLKVETYDFPVSPRRIYNLSQFVKVIKLAAKGNQKSMDKIQGISNLEEIDCDGVTGRAIISDDHQLLLWSVASRPQKIQLDTANVRHIRKSYPGQMLSRFTDIDLVQHFSLLNEGRTRYLAPQDADWLDCIDLLLDFAPNNIYDINYKRKTKTFDVHIHSGSFLVAHNLIEQTKLDNVIKLIRKYYPHLKLSIQSFGDEASEIFFE